MLFNSFQRPLWRIPDAGGGEGDPNGTPPPEGGDDKSKTFTQKDLDALVGKTRKEARQTAVNELLKELGVEAPEEVKTRLAELETLKKAQMSETERQKAELEKAQGQVKDTQSKMEAALQQANERLMKAAVLMEAGKPDHKVNPAALNDVWLFIDRAKLEMTDDGEVKGLAEAVKTVLEAKPYLQQNGQAKGVPPTPAPNGQELTDEQKRKQAVNARSYW